MCGIAGKIYSSNQEGIDDVVLKMCNKMVHRGPDSSGILKLGNITLGHRRLSIIDLSMNAAQPMSSADNRFHITFNGEIYNFYEIKNHLKKLGYNFKSDSDTEVVLYAYAEFGYNCLEKFNGMFAFAIWDSIEQQLFLARDRFGKKPLFYYRSHNAGFSFASEITALLEDHDIPRKISLSSLNCYLALGYVLNPATMYDNVYQLEPGSFIIVEDAGEKIERKKYWNYSEAFRIKTNESKNDIAEHLLYLLKQSVKMRLISDVPVGAFLSGGLDSSSIVALMKNHHKGELHTFSVGFKEDSYNELPDANRAAAFLCTSHHQLMCEMKGQEGLMLEAISVFDQLFADTSLLPMVEISKLASKYVTVVLSGDGADEMFAGYVTYHADRYHRLAKLCPRILKQYLAMLKSSGNNKLGRKYKAKQFFYGSLFDYRQAHYSWRMMFRPEERVMILGEKNKELVFDTDPWNRFRKYYDDVEDINKLDQHLYVDAMTWLTDDILVKLDRSAMYSSIEARTPYLDRELVSYAASIPSKYKLSASQGKYILKCALKDTLPDFIIEKKKSGFNAPVGLWLNNAEGDEYKTFVMYVLEYNKRTNGFI